MKPLHAVHGEAPKGAVVVRMVVARRGDERALGDEVVDELHARVHNVVALGDTEARYLINYY